MLAAFYVLHENVMEKVLNIPSDDGYDVLGRRALNLIEFYRHVYLDSDSSRVVLFEKRKSMLIYSRALGAPSTDL